MILHKFFDSFSEFRIFHCLGNLPCYFMFVFARHCDHKNSLIAEHLKLPPLAPSNYATRCDVREKCYGAVIGKALESLEKGVRDRDGGIGMMHMMAGLN